MDMKERWNGWRDGEVKYLLVLSYKYSYSFKVQLCIYVLRPFFIAFSYSLTSSWYSPCSSLLSPSPSSSSAMALLKFLVFYFHLKTLLKDLKVNKNGNTCTVRSHECVLFGSFSRISNEEERHFFFIPSYWWWWWCCCWWQWECSEESVRL